MPQLNFFLLILVIVTSRPLIITYPSLVLVLLTSTENAKRSAPAKLRINPNRFNKFIIFEIYPCKPEPTAAIRMYSRKRKAAPTRTMTTNTIFITNRVVLFSGRSTPPRRLTKSAIHKVKKYKNTIDSAGTKRNKIPEGANGSIRPR
jgi:hypothetical protein